MACIVVFLGDLIGGDFDCFRETWVCCGAVVAFVISIHWILISTSVPLPRSIPLSKLTQSLPIKLSIQLEALHIFKFSKIHLIQFILQAFVEFMKWSAVRASIEVDEDQPLASSVGFHWKEPVGRFVETGYILEAWCFDEGP